jgi:hypothetical protein
MDLLIQNQTPNLNPNPNLNPEQHIIEDMADINTVVAVVKVDAKFVFVYKKLITKKNKYYKNTY